MRPCALLLLLGLAVTALAQPKPDRIGTVEFFGHTGMNIDGVAAAIPLHEGDSFPFDDAQAGRKLMTDTLAAASKAAGKSATGINLVCCGADKQWVMFIGFAGIMVKPVLYRGAPITPYRLPEEAIKLSSAVAAAKNRGVEDPAAEAALRAYAASHEAVFREALESSNDARHRAAAALSLGYGKRSNPQVSILLYATRDNNEVVRNDAMQSLLVLVKADKGLSRRLPWQLFVDMLNSGHWDDRIRATELLAVATAGADKGTLNGIRAQAVASLLEMAQWRGPKQAHDARVILGRIDEVPEAELETYAAQAPEAFGR